jgi:uncharacterized membrane protein YphA (DoxX/SURF4 family)
MNFAHIISQRFPSALRSICVLLGAILLVSGVGKLIDASAAVRFLEYLLSTMNKTLPIASQTLMVGLSVLEIALGTAFLIGRFLKPAMFLTSVLLGAFTVTLAGAMGDNSVPTCGCSGAFDFGMPLEMALVRNTVLMVMITYVWKQLPSERQVRIPFV